MADSPGEADSGVVESKCESDPVTTRAAESGLAEGNRANVEMTKLLSEALKEIASLYSEHQAATMTVLERYLRTQGCVDSSATASHRAVTAEEAIIVNKYHDSQMPVRDTIASTTSSGAAVLAARQSHNASTSNKNFVDSKSDATHQTRHVEFAMINPTYVALKSSESTTQRNSTKSIGSKKTSKVAVVQEFSDITTETTATRDSGSSTKNHTSKSRPTAIAKKMDRRTVQDLISRKVSMKNQLGHDRILDKIVKSPNFDYFFGLCIVLNTILVGLNADFEGRHLGHVNEDGNRHFARAFMFFFVMFTIELALRILAYGSEFFHHKHDLWWNLFDLGMVVASWIELILKTQTAAEEQAIKSPVTRVIRVLRVARVSRTLRLGRMMRYAAAFRKIAFAMRATLLTLFWVLLMIFLVIYCFAVVIVQGSTDAIAPHCEVGPDGHATLNTTSASSDIQSLRLYFGTLPDAMYSLFKACTAGQNWGDLFDPMIAEDALMALVFLVFICVSFFGVLNVVTAVFVESALQAQQYYKELLIHDNVVKKQAYIAHLSNVFQEIDVDKSGSITADELEEFLAAPEISLYLESIDIYPNDARALFKLLDTEADGLINIDEFCEGCLRLKGEAKSFDVQCLIFNSERLLKKLTKLMEKADDEVGVPESNLSDTMCKRFCTTAVSS